MDKKNLLWVSASVPYDSVPHAGGKIENYYIKGVSKLDDFEVRLLTIANIDETNKIDLDTYNIQYDIIVHHYKGIAHLVWAALYRANKFNLFSKFGGFVSPYVVAQMTKWVKQIKQSGYCPDIIVLQWTEIVLLEEVFQKLYPGIPIVAVEEDVSFLSYERKYKAENRKIQRYIKKMAYKNLKRKEIMCLRKAQLVVLNNHKDYLLLRENGVCCNTWEWSPYFQSFIDDDYVGDSKDIIFYGAMNRDENWRSAIWFIENVWPIIKHDENIRFVIVGNKPPQTLLNYASDRIIVTGFVDSIEPYFKHGLCVAAPLVMGAGVKIKIIEAMSAGIPILTNSIGIEGIDASNNIHYFHCESAIEYAEKINEMVSESVDIKSISAQEKALVNEKYNCEKSLHEFNSKLILLCR